MGSEYLRDSGVNHTAGNQHSIWVTDKSWIRECGSGVATMSFLILYSRIIPFPTFYSPGTGSSMTVSPLWAIPINLWVEKQSMAPASVTVKPYGNPSDFLPSGVPAFM